jgi:leucyl-tRNA synthetase
VAGLPDYDAREIEERYQARWRDGDAFKTRAVRDGEQAIYIKASAPFTSGNVHIGHVRSYAIGDAYARFQRARGLPVLFAFGFDAFGLPAELGAIANEESPSEWVTRCAEHMTEQLGRLGFSFDWERTFMSSDPVMYRWSQWLFSTLLQEGLIYHGTGTVDWCDTCQTTLATIQVENGTCWRCHNPVRLIQRPQWYLKVSAYLQENDRRIDELAKWDETSLASQRYVLGRVDGFELEAKTEDGRELTVFTPHAEAVGELGAAAAFVLLSPKHPETERWADRPGVREQLQEMRLGGWERGSRAAETMALVDTGHVVRLDGVERALPVAVSPVVDERFGATAVLGVPALDKTDALIAGRLGIETDPAATDQSRPAPPRSAAPGATPAAATSATAATTSQPALSRARGGAPNDTPQTALTHARDGVREAVRYRADDFSISRQRAWGTPIPVVYCKECGTVPVPIEQQPVLLPRDLKPTGAGNPLAEREDFVNTTCPQCGGEAKRETDTLDCHFDALWLWVPACVPASERERPLTEIFALADLKAWLPAERLVAGSDSGNFMFDQRIATKALRDIGPLAFLEDGEPFAGALMHEMVIREGRKMSKHLGNVVDPDELVAKFGADTVRLAVLWAARPQKSLNWDDSAVQYCSRFLHGLWRYAHARFAAAAAAQSSGDSRRPDSAPPHAAAADGQQPNPPHAAAADGQQPDPAHTEHLRRRLEKWCATGVARITQELAELEMHKAVRDVMRLLDRIKDFEKKVLQRSGTMGSEDLAALVDALALEASVLAPFAPHIAAELLEASGRAQPQADPPWPEVQEPGDEGSGGPAGHEAPRPPKAAISPSTDADRATGRVAVAEGKAPSPAPDDAGRDAVGAVEGGG